MSVEVVRRYYDCFNRQDWAGMLGCLTEDVRHDINQGGTETGLENFKKFLNVMDEHYAEKVEDLCLMVSPNQTRVAAEFIIDGTYKKTQKPLPEAKGQHYRVPVGAFLEIRNGKISRVTNYYNLPKWIEAVSN